MVTNQSLWFYFAAASPVVKAVMLLLLTASIVSWTFIFQRMIYLKTTRKAAKQFEEKFWSGAELTRLYTDIDNHPEKKVAMAHIFYAGFKEFVRLRQQKTVSADTLIQGMQRSMRIASARESEKLEAHLSFLASVGSTSPYIGLFGTVWGIMTSFHALGQVQQATIAMVAPGISEALVATAMGLFAAIPAVLAYNRFASEVEKLQNQYDTFQEEFSSILYRQTHSQGS